MRGKLLSAPAQSEGSRGLLRTGNARRTHDSSIRAVPRVMCPASQGRGRPSSTLLALRDGQASFRIVEGPQSPLGRIGTTAVVSIPSVAVTLRVLLRGGY